LKFEVFYEQPPERVWAALTDATALAAWLMPNDFVPKLGHRFQLRTKPATGFDRIVNCEVLEIRPPQRLVYSWVGGGSIPELSGRLRRPTQARGYSSSM
jgi:uncharacterized protein YndB with AHSA1/START domain